MSAYLRFCALACLGLSAALGQISTGTVAGSVEDQTGAVVQNAEVTLKNTATGEVRQTRTNDRGEFNIPFARARGHLENILIGDRFELRRTFRNKRFFNDLEMVAHGLTLGKSTFECLQRGFREEDIRGFH